MSSTATGSDDLFGAAEAERSKRSRAEQKEAVDVEFVADINHIKALVTEVLTAAKPSAAELAKWRAAGHRTMVLTEAPLRVEGIIGHEVTVPGFRWTVRRWLDKDLVGTQIHMLSKKQYNGRWEVLDFKILDGTQDVLDTKVAVQKMEGMTDEIIGLGGDVPIEDFRRRRTNTIEVMIAWIDAAGAEELKYDVHGKEKDAPTVVINNTPAAAPTERIIVVERGSNPSVEDLVALASGKAKIEVKEPRERSEAQKAHDAKLAEMNRARKPE